MFNLSLDQEDRKKITIVTETDADDPVARIKIIGIGGGGCNAIGSMIQRGLSGVEFIALNTDLQSLRKCAATTKVQIGRNLTRGLGAGSDVTVGQKAVEEDREKIAALLGNCEMVFITTGLGGGTGTGGAPVIASIAKSQGALVVAIVTKPFTVEGVPRNLIADKGLEKLREQVDSIIVIKNEILRSLMGDKCSVFEMFDKPNEVLYDATKGISELVIFGGEMNVDFADVKRTMKNGGDTLIGSGRAKGPNRAKEAATKAVSSPLLEGTDIRGSKQVLVNITASSAVSAHDFFDVTEIIRETVGPDADTKFGVRKDETIGDEIIVTVIATGYNKSKYLNSSNEEDNFNFIPRIEPTTKPDKGPRLVQIKNQSTPQPKLKIVPDITEVTPYSSDNIKNYDIPPMKRIGGNLENFDRDEDTESFSKHFFDATKKVDQSSEKSSLLKKLMS